jgi:hypothetical protein
MSKVVLYTGLLLIFLLAVLITFLSLQLLYGHRKNANTLLSNSLPQNNKNAMVIVEPRPHKLLQAVIENFHGRMDFSWDLYVFHGKDHGSYAEHATKNVRLSTRNVFLIPLEVNNLSATEYNSMFKTISFWDRVNAENILVFQTDTVLCSNSKTTIDDFMTYPYIGCAYTDQEHGSNSQWNSRNQNDKFYGVGGLSFRKKSFMINCIRQNANNNAPEDCFFSNCVHKMDTRPKSALDIGKFCTQDSYFADSFGAHKVNEQLHKKDMASFLQYCPEAKILL